MIRFSIAIFVISILLFFALLFGNTQGYFPIPSFSNEIIGFLSLSTLGVYFYLIKKIANNPQDFTGAFLLTLVLRFLLFAGFMLVIILLDKPGATYNALFFMITYVMFTAAEVAFLYRKVMSSQSSK